MSAYTVSKDIKSGLWYAHMKGFPHVPVFGSFSEKKSESMKYAKMYNNLPHRVDKVKKEKHKNMEEYLNE